MAREFGRNQAIYPVFTEFELSDSITSTELPFRQTKSNNGGARKGSYNSSGNIETTSKNKLSNSNPITPPLYGSVSEIERVVEPSSLIRAYNTAHTSNWSVPANTNGLRKTKSVYSSSPMHYSFGNGTSNSPVRSPARLPVFSECVQGTWCAVIAYDACVRLCLHAWAQSYCAEVQGFLENESALLRDAFEAELLAEQRPSQPINTLAAPAPKHVKASGKIKLQVRKVKMDSDEQPSSCSFPSPKLPRIRYDSCCRRFSNLRSTLSSALNSTQNIKLISNGSFSHWSLACLGAGRKCIKQGSSFLKMRANTLCNRSSLYEGVQETYSCFVRLTSSPEEDAVQMQPGSGETRVLFPNSVGDDVIIQVQNSKGQHCGCGHALVKVAAIADEPIQFSEFSNSLSGDKIRWWPIYSSDLEDEPVGRIQLSMDYSSIPVENSNLKYGSIAETVVYDCVLEIAMKVQHFQERNLLLHGLWKWLLTEFASYYGVSKAYTNLRYLSYVMDVATPTVDCLTLLYDLLADVKEMSTNLLSHQEHCILAKIEDQVRKLVALVFENYKSLEESSLLGMVDGFTRASGLAAPALAPAVQIYTLLNDILSPEAQLKLSKFFQRLRVICAETDELVLTSNEGAQKDFLTSYQRMKSLILNIRNEILTDIQILNQNVLPSCIDLPNISSCIYSVNLCNRLSTFLVVRPPPSLSPLVAELIIATADFQQDLSLWNISPIKGEVDAKELFDAHIFLWILDKHRHLLGQCKLDKAKWSGVRTEYGTTHFVDYMHTELKGMLDEFEVIISRWPIYSSPLENVIADVEKAIIEALDRHYDDVLSPLKDNLTNKTLGFKYVQKLSRQSISTYSVPNELGILLNSMKRTLDVLWPHIESQLMSRSSCIRDGYATGEHLNDVSALLRTKLRTYRLAIVEKLYENTRVRNKTKLKNIIQRSKAENQSRMKPLEVLLREMFDHLHTVVDPTVFVELCQEFWDRLGQDVLHILEDKKEEYKGLRVAVSNLDDIFASEMQRLRRNSLKERDLSPPGSMEEVHSMLKDVVRM
ncbi:hypothetical protein ACFX19_000492 [Malus domestica]